MTLRSRLGRNRWGSEAGRKTRMLRPDDGSWQRSGNGRCCGRAQVVKGRQGLMRDAMAAGRAVKWFVNGGISFASWCVRGSELSRGWAGMVQNSGRWKLFGVGGQTLQPSSLCSQNPGLRRGCFLQLWPSLARSLQPPASSLSSVSTRLGGSTRLPLPHVLANLIAELATATNLAYPIHMHQEVTSRSLMKQNEPSRCGLMMARGERKRHIESWLRHCIMLLVANCP